MMININEVRLLKGKIRGYYPDTTNVVVLLNDNTRITLLASNENEQNYILNALDNAFQS
jgi:hypothetical protein